MRGIRPNATATVRRIVESFPNIVLAPKGIRFLTKGPYKAPLQKDSGLLDDLMTPRPGLRATPHPRRTRRDVHCPPTDGSRASSSSATSARRSKGPAGRRQ